MPRPTSAINCISTFCLCSHSKSLLTSVVAWISKRSACKIIFCFSKQPYSWGQQVKLEKAQYWCLCKNRNTERSKRFPQNSIIDYKNVNWYYWQLVGPQSTMLNSIISETTVNQRPIFTDRERAAVNVIGRYSPRFLKIILYSPRWGAVHRGQKKASVRNCKLSELSRVWYSSRTQKITYVSWSTRLIQFL